MFITNGTGFALNTVWVQSLGGDAMQTMEGEMIKSCLDGMNYTVKTIFNGMVVLESKSGNKQGCND